MAWLAVASLGGCSGGDDPSPFADSRTPPGLAERFYPPEGWAWGYVQVGDGPVQRYGVAAGAGAPIARVLILPDYGQSAETWFETIGELNRRGCTVWVLEGVGQGGSGRLTRTRDLGHVRDFDADIAGARAMAESVVRPWRGTPLIVLGEGVGAAIAVRAVAQGLAADGVVLSQAALDAAAAPDEEGLARLRWLGLGATRAPDRRAWPPGALANRTAGERWRVAAAERWRRTNPDLRMAGPSLDWIAAQGENNRLAGEALDQLAVPVLVTRTRLETSCRGLARCRTVGLTGGGGPPELADDAVRDAWLSAVESFARGVGAEAKAH